MALILHPRWNESAAAWPVLLECRTNLDNKKVMAKKKKRKSFTNVSFAFTPTFLLKNQQLL